MYNRVFKDKNEFLSAVREGFEWFKLHGAEEIKSICRGFLKWGDERVSLKK